MEGNLNKFTEKAEKRKNGILDKYYVSDVELAIGPVRASLKLSPKEKAEKEVEERA